MDRVGIRELRQNLSVYIRRIKRGETLEVTERGHPVAVLAPLRSSGNALDRLIASGQAIPPSKDLKELGPPRGRPSRRASRALEELRGDRL